MPVEIKELVIRAVVDKGAAAEPKDDAPGGPAAAAACTSDTAGTEGIVRECVRQVLRILAKDKER